MKTRTRNIGSVLGALLLATCLVALQLLSIGLALNEIASAPEVPELRAAAAPARDPAPGTLAAANESAARGLRPATDLR